MRETLFYLFSIAVMTVSPVTYSSAQSLVPSDPSATKETIHLYQNLKKLMDKGILFGHQDDLAYVVGVVGSDMGDID